MRDAVALATPLSLDDAAEAAVAVDDAADAKSEPTVAGRFAKGFGKALLDGFFNTRQRTPHASGLSPNRARRLTPPS